MVEAFVLVISIWGNNGTDWVYTGNQYIMSELFTEEQCLSIADTSNWNKIRSNQYYDLQFDCFNKEEYNG
jgi:hypothetical protein